MNRKTAIGMLLLGVVGWAACGATISVGMATTTLSRALLIHLVAAPLIFVMLSWLAFSRFGAPTPWLTAVIFTAIVVFLDVFVVATFIERSFAMFRSIMGTWAPFALIFLATWGTGRLVRARPR